MLPNQMVEGRTVKSFKAKIDKLYGKNCTFKTLKRMRYIAKESKIVQFFFFSVMSKSILILQLLLVIDFFVFYLLE